MHAAPTHILLELIPFWLDVGNISLSFERGTSVHRTRRCYSRAYIVHCRRAAPCISPPWRAGAVSSVLGIDRASCTMVTTIMPPGLQQTNKWPLDVCIPSRSTRLLLAILGSRGLHPDLAIHEVITNILPSFT